MLKTSLMCHSLRRIQRGQGCQPRGGTTVMWVLPVIVIVALVGYLCFAPGPRRPISAAEIPVSNETSEEFGDPEAAEIDGAANSPSVITSKDVSSNSAARLVEHQLQGEWTGFYQGRRCLTVRSDGTCTMTAEPEGLAASLLAAKLTFEIRWKMNGQHMEFETIGGEPLDKVNVVLRMYGSKRSHKILKLQRDELVLLDEDGVTRYEWRRVASD